MILFYWTVLVVAVFILLIVLFILRNQKRLPVSSTSRCLLVIAHPDDETMFFGPTLLQLRAMGVQVFVLCITSGNAYGQGSIRKKELSEAVVRLGLQRENLTILDMTGYPDGNVKWETEKLSSIVLSHLEKLDCDIVITFDEGGVSGHSNHIACFHTLQFLYTNGHIPAGVQVFVLETVPLRRKYIGCLDLFCSYIYSTFLFVANPWPTYMAMREHRSQLLWYRYLYMCFSRYVLINTLRRIPLHRFCTKNK
jgi:N-acetylglucosaminylphosphatidylinositol deacetylase